MKGFCQYDESAAFYRIPTKLSDGDRLAGVPLP
jgi:hypothetical protein